MKKQFALFNNPIDEVICLHLSQYMHHHKFSHDDLVAEARMYFEQGYAERSTIPNLIDTYGIRIVENNIKLFAKAA